MYREYGKPSCIIGHVLDRMGVTYNPRWEARNAGYILKDAPDELTRALVEAQKYQDKGMTWGNALERYRDSVGV